MAAGTISVTALTSNNAHDGIQEYIVNWTTTSGNIANDVLKDANGTPIQFNGTLLQVAYKAGDATTGAATLTNASGINVLGTICSTLTAALQDTPLTPSGIPYILNGTLSLSVTGGGSVKTGALYVWTR